MRSGGGQLKSLLLGGILPVVIFTVLEEKYGTLWGLIGGMVLGGGEIIYEWFSFKKVDTITWIGNGLLIGMGLFSLWTNEGVWFKLQPAIISEEVFRHDFSNWGFLSDPRGDCGLGSPLLVYSCLGDFKRGRVYRNDDCLHGTRSIRGAMVHLEEEESGRRYRCK